jgi:hypothetical protein
MCLFKAKENYYIQLYRSILTYYQANYLILFEENLNILSNLLVITL